MGDAFLVQNIKSVSEPTIVQDGLILHLDAGKTSSYSGTGNTWFDISGNSRNATRINNVSFNSNGWFTLNGTSHYFSLPTSALPTGNEGTVQVWIKDAISRTQTLFASESGSSRYLMAHAPWENGLFYFDWQNDTSGRINTSSTVNTSGWNMFTFVRKSNGVQELWRNETLLLSETKTISTLPSANTFTIGRELRNSTSYWLGDLSIFAVYNKALEPSEITENFNLDRSRFGL
jgi:flagellar hook-associated protein FlgK